VPSFYVVTKEKADELALLNGIAILPAGNKHGITAFSSLRRVIGKYKSLCSPKSCDYSYTDIYQSRSGQTSSFALDHLSIHTTANVTIT